MKRPRLPGQAPDPFNPSDDPATDGIMKEYSHTGSPDDDEAFVSRVMRAAGLSRKVVGGKGEQDWPWLFSNAFWRGAAAAAVILGAWIATRTFSVHSALPDPTEVYVFTQPRVIPGQTSAVRVLVRDAHNLEPLAKAEIAAWVTGPMYNHRLPSAKTDENGLANISADFAADIQEGEYKIEVEAAARTGHARAEQVVHYSRSFRTMLSTDKPLYQPGQVIHMRALSLEADTLAPAADRPVAFEVRDAKGNKVFRKSIPTSAFGIAATDFKLADQVNTGSYTIAVEIGGVTSERTVTVDRYVLPKFRVDVTTEKPFYAPGDTLKLSLDAQYTFGKAVTGGEVKISAQEFVTEFTPFADASGRTNGSGKYEVEIPLKSALVGQPLNQGDAFVRLVATVTDRSGETQSKTLDVKVTNDPIRVEVFPESGELVQGIENVLYILTAYPDGSPAKTTIYTARGESFPTSELGIGKMTVTPKPGEKLTLTARDEAGNRVRVVKDLRVGEARHGILLRTDAAVYKQGESAALTVLSSSPAKRVFLDVVKSGRSFITSTIEMDKGTGVYALDLPPDLSGTVELQAYAIEPDGEISRDTKLIQVQPANQIAIQAKLNAESYKPAEKAMVDFLVTSAEGKPLEAALSLSAVDEAVFALNDARPGLEAMYFLIQEEILKPRYQLVAMPPANFTSAPENTNDALKEANVVAFAAGNDAGAPASSVSEPYSHRGEQLKADREAYDRGLVRLLPLIPFGLFLGLVGLFLAYGFSRVRVKPEGTMEKMHADVFRKKVRAFFWMVLAAVLSTPLILIGLGAMGLLREEVHAVVALIFILCVWTTALAVKARELRQLQQCARHLPLFRKAVAIIPAAYLFAGIVVLGLLAAVQIEQDAVPEEFVMWIVGASLVLLLMAAGVVRYLRRGLTEVRPLAQRIRSLSLNAALPPVICTLLVMGLVMASNGGGFEPKRKMAIMQRGGAVPEGAREFDMMMPMAAAPSPVPEPSMPAEDAAGAAEPVRVRKFFPETLLWQPQLLTNAEGKAQLEIPLADSITTWRMAGSAVSKAGQLGSFQQGIRVFQDFFIDIDFPVELTQNDEVTVPIAVFNYLEEPQTIHLEAQPSDWYELVNDEPQKSLQAKAGAVMKSSFRLRALKPGRHALTVLAQGTTLSDAVERTVRIIPDGQRVERVINGRLKAEAKELVSFPADAIEGGSDLYLKIYPGAFSQVVEGMDSIFRMPSGCFEQTSSTTYPNILVLDYLRTTKQAKPELEMKALDFIAQGYQRLLSYEVEGGGFEWFGRGPAHNILSAYGLLEFTDMSKVYEIDAAVIERTRQYLMAQRAGDGSWKPSEGGIAEGAINSFQGGEEAVLRSTAYIAWAIAHSGGKDLARSFDFLAAKADASKDPYTLALIANAFLSADRRAEGVEVLKQLDTLKTGEGEFVFWKAEGGGLTYGGGDSFAIETTALAAQALMRAGHQVDMAHKALGWLISKRDGGGTWHSTQATVQAMKALLLGASSAGQVEGQVNVGIAANGQAQNGLLINQENKDVFHLVSLSSVVQPGDNEVALKLDAAANLAYQIVAVHYEPRKVLEGLPEPEILEIRTDYSTTQLEADDLLTVTVELKYNRPEAAPMTLVDLGLPPGFEIEAASFQKLVEEKVIQRFEPKARQVTLYFDMIPGGGQSLFFKVQLRAKFPVKAQVPATVAYQYYEPEVRAESEVMQITVE